jgi:hypothetical protein
MAFGCYPENFWQEKNILTQGLIISSICKIQQLHNVRKRQDYIKIARKNGLTLTELSLAFIEQQSLWLVPLLGLQQWNN